MKKLELVGHIWQNGNLLTIVTPSADVKAVERSLDMHIAESGIFPHHGYPYPMKKVDKIAAFPKVRVTITVEEI